MATGKIDIEKLKAEIKEALKKELAEEYEKSRIKQATPWAIVKPTIENFVHQHSTDKFKNTVFIGAFSTLIRLTFQVDRVEKVPSERLAELGEFIDDLMYAIKKHIKVENNND